MSDWPNPALWSEKLKPVFTIVSWCLSDDKNKCKICPCLWNGTPDHYTYVAQPCGPPFVALASTATGFLINTSGEYYWQEAGDTSAPGYLITAPPLPNQPMRVVIDVYKAPARTAPYGGGWTLVETIPWFDIGSGEQTFFDGHARVVFQVGPPSHPTIVATIWGKEWRSQAIHPPIGDLILASQDNPYPNGTYDMIYSDSSGVYDHYIPWVEGPIPGDYPDVWTQYFINVKEGSYSEPTNVGYGLPWTTSHTGTAILTQPGLAVYGRVECSYAHENAGIPPYPPLPA